MCEVQLQLDYRHMGFYNNFLTDNEKNYVKKYIYYCWWETNGYLRYWVFVIGQSK